MFESKYFSDLEKQNRIYLNTKEPLIIRLDGKDVTKDKEKYDLTMKEGYVDCVNRAAIRTLKDFRCEAVLYSIMDEISIIIYDSASFFGNFEEPNQLYCSVIFLQRFLSSFRTFFSTTEFGVSMFNISASDIPDYLEWRKGFGNLAAIVYAAKKFGVEFHNREKEEILKEINKIEPVWYKSHQWFFEGVCDTNTSEIQEEIVFEY